MSCGVDCMVSNILSLPINGYVMCVCVTKLGHTYMGKMFNAFILVENAFRSIDLNRNRHLHHLLMFLFNILRKHW